MLLCLGLDFRHGGFVDRALEAFQEVVRLDPREPLRAGQSAEAARRPAAVGRRPRACASRLRRSTRAGGRSNQQILGFLRNQIGTAGARRRQRGCLRDVSRRRSTSTADRARLSEPRRHAAIERGDMPAAIDGVGRAGADGPGARLSGVRPARTRLSDAWLYAAAFRRRCASG